ncbi:25283_t:CDS:2, partial [Gigaspora rosea]
MSSNQKTYCRKETLSTSSIMYNKTNNIENIVENNIIVKDENDCVSTDEDICSSVDELIQQLRTDLKQTRELITALESPLQKKPSNDNFHLSHSTQCLGLPSTRSRSSSRSSNVSNWLMNHYSPANSAWECGCGYCVLCLASDNISIIESRPASTRTTPRTSRRNSIASRQKCLNSTGNHNIPDIPEENFVNRKQRQLSVIKRLYRYQLEHKSDYKRTIIGILIGILQNGFISSKRNGNLYYKRKLMGGPLLLTIISRALYAKRNNGVRSKKDVIAMIK